MKPKSHLAIATLLLSLTPFTIAQETSPATQPTTQPTTQPIPPDLLNQIQSDLKKIKTVEADFIQEKKLAMLDHTLLIRGHFAMQQPDRLIWIVREPLRYAISVHGEEVRQWDEDTNRVDVIHLGKDPTFRAVSDQIQAWFLGNYEVLGKSYDLALLSQKPLALRFSPKPNTMLEKVFHNVDVTFADDHRYIEKMTLIESTGDSTTLTFLHTQVDHPIKDETWRIPPNDH